MATLETWGRGLKWGGHVGLGLATVGLGLALFRTWYGSLYVPTRICLHLGPWPWPMEASLRLQATLLLALWAIPLMATLASLTRFFRHLESGEPFRQGLAQPIRLLGGVALWISGMTLLLRPWYGGLFPLLALRWVWFLKPLGFLFLAAALFAVARLMDEACALRAEQDLVI